MRQHTILLADDEDTLRMNLAEVLDGEGFDVIACPNGTEALRALKSNSIDAIITDLRMPGVTGMELIGHAQKLAPDAGIIVITAFGEVETAVESMKSGANDYICKPLIFDELVFRLKRLLSQDEIVKQNKVLRDQIRQNNSTEMIGQSPSMLALKDAIKRISQTTSNVLICGESGTGKEVLARAIHYSGVTSQAPFVAVNCGGLADSLVESELFGYRRGAFTGANSDHMGYFEAADGGTLFLDEIGNFPLKSQAILLRAIEQRAITRVGDHRLRPVTIRIIAATNRELEKAIEIDKFREDLFFRLNVIRLTVPPLCERTEDIPLLAKHFSDKYEQELNMHCEGFSPDAIEALANHPWRGNVRELANVVERAIIFCNDKIIGRDDLGFAMSHSSSAATSACNELRAATQAFERQHILKVLNQMSNNKMASAESLGIGLSSLYRKMEELGIPRDRHHVGRLTQNI